MQKVEEITYQDLNEQEKEWFDKVMNKYNRGFITETDRDTAILEIKYHYVNPGYPIYL